MIYAQKSAVWLWVSFIYMLHVCVCVLPHRQRKSLIITFFLPVDTNTLRDTVEQLTIHGGMDAVIIAAINAASFISVLSHVLRSLVREKRSLLAVQCVLKSQRLCLMMQLHLVGVLLWSILFSCLSMLQFR